MREFHEVMIKYQTIVSYTPKAVTIKLVSCSLQSLKDIANVISSEFEVSEDDIKISSSEGMVALKVPLTEDEDTEDQTPQFIATHIGGYSLNVLETAIELLKEKGAMSATELSLELEKKGIEINPRNLGKLLSSSGRAIRIGHRWRYYEGIQNNRIEHYNEGDWIQLTEKGYFRVDNDDVVIGFKRIDGKINGYRRFSVKILEAIYNELPPTSTTTDFGSIALKYIGKTPLAPILFRIMARLFGGKVVKKGNSFLFIKGGD